MSHRETEAADEQLRIADEAKRVLDSREPKTSMTDQQQYAVATVLEFSDGDDISVNVIHIGDLDSCKSLVNLVSAISYSGNRPVKSSQMVVRRWPPPEDTDPAPPTLRTGEER